MKEVIDRFTKATAQLDLAGQIEFAPDFDHKAFRQTRHATD